MNLFLQGAVFLGVGLLAYAVLGMLIPAQTKKPTKKPKEEARFPKPDKILPKAAEVTLPTQEEKIIPPSDDLKKEIEAAKGKEAQIRQELTRKQEWLDKAEEALNKTKEENADLKRKFIEKEKELQG
jgi:chromosome segregation ATPase